MYVFIFTYLYHDHPEPDELLSNSWLTVGKEEAKLVTSFI